MEEIYENHQNKPKKLPNFAKYKWWIQIAIYSTFVLSGQAIGTLLGKLYFNKGGNNIWLASLVQNIGFPILIPFLLLSSTTNNSKTAARCTETPETPEVRENNFDITKKPCFLVLVPLYVSLGLFLGGNCMLYSIGQFYLPATTYTLICTSQLGFNALFSFFLNKEKITHFIVNSLVLVSISCSLILFQNDDDESNSGNKYTKRKYVVGFLCTLGASAGYGLMLSVTRLSFERIFKRESLRLIVEMTIYESLVASLATLVVISGSGEWRDLRQEMDEFELGRKIYVLNLVMTAISWQVFTVGSTGLIFKVSSLFSNVISILGVPMAPVFYVLFLHEKMSGVKVVSMFLAMWGFLSYMYQHYLDDLENKAEKRDSSMHEAFCIQEGSREERDSSVREAFCIQEGSREKRGSPVHEAFCILEGSREKRDSSVHEAFCIQEGSREKRDSSVHEAFCIQEGFREERGSSVHEAFCIQEGFREERGSSVHEAFCIQKGSSEKRDSSVHEAFCIQEGSREKRGSSEHEAFCIQEGPARKGAVQCTKHSASGEGHVKGESQGGVM